MPVTVGHYPADGRVAASSDRLGARLGPPIRLCMVRVLVLGATGQVGGALVERASRDPRVSDVIATSRSDPDPLRRADLRDEAALGRTLVASGPSHVVLAAAATNVAWCEANPEEARVINVDGTANVVEACRRVGASVTFFSTDYVFDGTAGPYPETAKTHPINIYGRHKREAETIVLNGDSDNLVVRTCQVFGRDTRRRNYVLRTADELRAGRVVEAPTDLYGTPTFAPDLVAAVLMLMQARASGVWHVAGDRHLSRFDLARMVATAFGVEGAQLVATTAAAADGVDRPRMSGLRTIRTEVERPRMTPLEDALATLAAEDPRP